MKKNMHLTLYSSLIRVTWKNIKTKAHRLCNVSHNYIPSIRETKKPEQHLSKQHSHCNNAIGSSRFELHYSAISTRL